MGVTRAWEDARQYYSNLDPRAFLPPDPTDTEFGQMLLDRLIEAAERPDRFIRVAELGKEAVGFITATLHEPADESGRQPLPVLLEIRHVSRSQHQVQWTLTKDLISDEKRTALRITDLPSHNRQSHISK